MHVNLYAVADCAGLHYGSGLYTEAGALVNHACAPTCAVSLYLPISPCISLHLEVRAHVRRLPISPYISLHLPASREVRAHVRPLPPGAALALALAPTRTLTVTRCAVSFRGRTWRLHALRDIARGEEVCCSRT